MNPDATGGFGSSAPMMRSMWRMSGMNSFFGFANVVPKAPMVPPQRRSAGKEPCRASLRMNHSDPIGTKLGKESCG